MKMVESRETAEDVEGKEVRGKDRKWKERSYFGRKMLRRQEGSCH